MQNLVLPLGLLLVGLGSARIACGQGLGELTGTVTDPSGSAIAGAKVVASEAGTGFSRSVSTSAEGFFTIPSLHPSTYDLTVTAPGFRPVSSQGIVLRADQSAAVNLRLEVGAVTETVNVDAQASQVDTSTATIKSVVDNRQIVELPLNGRNAAALTLLVPGAVQSISNGADQGQTKTFPGAVTISANGSRQMVTSFLLDGGNNVDEYTNVNAPFPFPDALQEFSVQTSNYSAEYGQNAGGVVNIITKSGTNQVHGDLFEFVRNAQFNARNFFLPTREPLKRNQYGATFGGPVYLPHLYNGRDKTFFFFGYQGNRIRNLGAPATAIVPTPANIAGDFSDRLSATSPGNPLHKVEVIGDPLSPTGSPFPGNIIPNSRFDPATVKMLTFLPQGSGNGSIVNVKPISQNFYDIVTKVDHSIGANDKFAGRYYGAKFHNQGVYNPANILTYTDQANIFSQNALIQETHIFSPQVLNDFRLNYARENSVRGPIDGVPNVNDFGVNLYQPPSFKGIESGGISVSGFFSFGDNLPARFTRNNFTLQDDFHWVKGRHSLAFGFHGELTRVDLDNQFQRTGLFTFAADAPVNDSMASLMLGRISTFRQANGEFKNNRNFFSGVYALDSFRISSRLTLNYGIRWEPSAPWKEVRGRTEMFFPDLYAKGVTSQLFTNANVLPGLLFAGDPGVSERGLATAWNVWMPRLGFAYDLSGNGKTSIRGGGGAFYDSRQSGIFNNRFADVSPFSTNVNLTPPPGPFSDPLRGYPLRPFPAAFPPPKDYVFPLPVLVESYDVSGKFKPPVSYNWNLAIEHQFAGNWLARAAYVGSHSSRLTQNIELNPAVFGGSGSTDARRLFKNFSNITEGSEGGNSRYHSLQLSAEKRLSHNLTITANYTWSKSTDNLPVNGSPGGPTEGGSFVYPWYFPNADGLDRGPSDFDHRQRFVMSYVWQLPVLAKTNPLVRTVAGGWQLSGVFQAQTGAPLTITAGKDVSLTGLNRDRAVITGAPYGPGACGTSVNCVDYLNPASFALPAAGGFGNVGKGLLRSPGMAIWDVGMFKNFRVKERAYVQFRAEFFNVLNRVNFNGPNGNDSTTASYNGGQFGIKAAFDPRIGQLALKIVF